MTRILTTLRTAALKRADYRRTKRELSQLPVNVALDLDLYPGDADHLARRAVYGL